MIRFLAILLLSLVIRDTASVPLDSSRIPPGGWVVGSNLGVIGGIPPRTNGATVVDITLPPYSADTNGIVECNVAINSAITAATSNTVIYFPVGRYKITSTILLSKSGITLRGVYNGSTIFNTAGSSSQCIRIGATEVSPVETISIYSGATRGSTNIAITGTTFTIAGDNILVQERNITNVLMQVISTTGFPNLRSQVCRVISKSDVTNLVVWPPLLMDYTNAPSITLITGATVSPDFKPIVYSGAEDLIFSMTNEVDSTSGTATFIGRILVANDVWFKGCKFLSPQNYNLAIANAVNVDIGGCTIKGRYDIPTSNHGGELCGEGGAVYTYNCVFEESLFPAQEINSGWSGNFTYGCLFTNIYTDVLVHNAHPMYNGWEENTGLLFESDGYFGSASHHTIYRCNLSSTFVPVYFKRFTSYSQVIGSILGRTNITYSFYSSTNSGDGSSIIQLGYPNIGNHAFVGRTSPTWQWNWPGTNSLDTVLVNGYTFTNTQTATTNLVGNFSWVDSPVYALWIQRAANTNYYDSADSGGIAQPYAVGTATNLLTTKAVSVLPGDTIYLVGSRSFQALQTSNVLTHVFNGNYDYFNHAQTFDPAYTPTLYAGILYSNTPPSWWYRTNTINSAYYVSRYPAVQPESSPLVTLIAPQIWNYDGSNPFAQGDTTPTPPTPPSQVINLTVSGKVTVRGKVTLQ